jgi:hypothetical protein
LRERAITLRKALSAILLVTTTIAAQADPSQYLCIAEQAAGLSYDKQTKAWGPQAFVTHKKYILRRLNDDDRKNKAALLKKYPNADWGFFDFEQAFPTALCNSEDSFHCVWGHMDFDKGSLRFERAYYSAYTAQGFLETLREKEPNEYKSLADKYHDPENPDDLAIEIGKCSPF